MAERFDWNLGFGDKETGTIVRIKDEHECCWGRFDSLDAAIANYRATANYDRDPGELVAELVLDGEGQTSKRFRMPQ